MTATAQLLTQRASGHVKLHMGEQGIVRLREEGSAKVRIPPNSHEAILINTAGGLAGGDVFKYEAIAEQNSKLCITSQSAERVYKTLGPPATINSSLAIHEHATLQWLPRETILYDGSSLNRSMKVDLAKNAKFIGLESVIFGRDQSGEKINTLFYSEIWRIARAGVLLHADNFTIDGGLPRSQATLGNASAIASLIMIDEHLEPLAERLTTIIGNNGAVSTWNGKLFARLHAIDGFQLRKVLNSVLSVILGDASLPKTWAF